MELFLEIFDEGGAEAWMASTFIFIDWVRWVPLLVIVVSVALGAIPE